MSDSKTDSPYPSPEPGFIAEKKGKSCSDNGQKDKADIKDGGGIGVGEKNQDTGRFSYQVLKACLELPDQFHVLGIHAGTAKNQMESLGPDQKVNSCRQKHGGGVEEKSFKTSGEQKVYREDDGEAENEGEEIVVA